MMFGVLGIGYTFSLGNDFNGVYIKTDDVWDSNPMTEDHIDWFNAVQISGDNQGYHCKFGNNVEVEVVSVI